MAQCPKCGSNNASYKREVVGSTGSGSNVRVRVSKHISVGSSGGSSKKHYRTIGFCPDCGYTWSTASRNPFVTALLWLFIYIPFFPITLSIWFWKTPRIKMEKKKKAIILAVIWVVLFIIGILTPGDNSNNQNSRGSASKTTSVSSVEETTEVKSEDVLVQEDAEEVVVQEEVKEVEEEKEDEQINFFKNDLINQFISSIPEAVELPDKLPSRSYMASFVMDDCGVEIQDLESEFRLRVIPPDPDSMDKVLRVTAILAKVLDPDISDSDIEIIKTANADHSTEYELDSKSVSFSFTPRIDSEESGWLTDGHADLSSTKYGK